MRSLLLAVLAAYVVAAIHAVLAFLNKRRVLLRVSEWAMGVGFLLHTAALIADWVIYAHYPLFYLRETLSFLAWTLVASYALVRYRYRAQPLGSFTLPLVSILIFIAIITRSEPSVRRSQRACRPPGFFRFTLPYCFCLRRVLCRLHGEHHVPVAGTRTKTENVQRDLSPAAFTDNSQRNSHQRAAIGLTLLTFGIATGMLWSSSRDGRYGTMIRKKSLPL